MPDSPRPYVQAVLGMEMLSTEDDDGSSDEYVRGYNACLAVVRSYLEPGSDEGE